MPKYKSPVPKNESKKARFERLAELRTNNALDAIRKIGALAHNRQLYEYTDSQLQAITSALESSLDDLKSDFERASGHGPKARRAPFTLHGD